MPALVFRLRNVPDDEANAVRSLMEEHHIECYETTAGSWGIAVPGLWVVNTTDTEKARSLIDTYQQERSSSLRSQYQKDLRSGKTPTLLDRVQAQPLQVAGIVVFCLFILYATLNPFLQLIGYTK